MYIKEIIQSIVYRFRGEISTYRLKQIGLRVGRNFRRNEHCIIDQSHCWLIEIGDNVTLAPRVHILAHDASMWFETGYSRIAPVRIGNNVFIGAGSIILPGCTIGDNVVIGAGSLVTHSIDGNSVVAGNPARRIMDYDDFISKHKERQSKSTLFDVDYSLNNSHFTSEMKMAQLQSIKNKPWGGYQK